MPDLSDIAQASIDRFLLDQRTLGRRGSGRMQPDLARLTAGAEGTRQGFGRQPPLPETAAALLDWVARIPDAILPEQKATLPDFSRIPEDEARARIGAGLRVIQGAALALLAGRGAKGGLPRAEAVVQVAFGGDAASEFLRNPLVEGLPDGWPDLPVPKRNRLERLILDGTLRDLLTTLATCGEVARQETGRLAAVLPFGRVTALSPARACGGGTLTVSFSGFGTAPPNASQDILVSLPRRWACLHVSLRRIAPHLFQPGGWQDSGQFQVTLPADVFSGAVGMFIVPMPVEQSGCTPGGLVAAAGQLQSVLGDVFGPAGVLIGQPVLETSLNVEAGRQGQIACAMSKPGAVDWLMAGPPVIDRFEVVDVEPARAFRTIRLRWSVANAETVRIVARTASGSLSPHELPLPRKRIGMTGEVTLKIAASRRWEGEYVLQAMNANGCSRLPVEQVLPMTGWHSSYRFGVARVDITDPRPGLPLLGFSDEAQKVGPGAPVDLPLYARAFAIAENGPKDDPLVMVVCDLWGCSQMLKAAVIGRVKAMNGRQLADDCLLIAGTHTHAAMGGYYEYHMYNLAGQGFIQSVFSRLVEGIALSVVQALARMRPGTIKVNSGEIADCGGNRSFAAYLRNADAQPGNKAHWIDRDMLLLRFEHDIDNRGGTPREVAALNWHALHPTSLGMFNDRLSGDNKGWAARLFEDRMAASAPGFVAAFANAAAGDVSGNVVQDDSGGVTLFRPMGSPGDAADHGRMHALADQQFQHALALYATATEEVAGPLQSVHQHIDMANVVVAARGGLTTQPAAMGISFGAGSTEDGDARAKLGEGAFVGSHIFEGYDQSARQRGVIELVPVVAGVFGLLAGLVPAIIGGVPVVILNPGSAAATVLATAAATAPVAGAAAPLVLSITPADLAALLDTLLPILPPAARGLVTSTVAIAMFPGKLADQVPQAGGGESYGWVLHAMPTDWPLTFHALHGAKPIMFAPGLAELDVTRNGTVTRVACPLVPNEVPFHLIRLGQVSLVGVAAELTSTAGRRLKAEVSGALGLPGARCAIFGYANSYSGYVTTAEEYDAQHYEGASTLYGPFTLEAYQQEFRRLSQLLASGSKPPVTTAFVPPAIFKSAMS